MIVNEAIKIDLHIHSEYSRNKDGSKVAFNTIRNLSVLRDKLEESEVSMCSITDHNVFSYDMYSGLKVFESKGTCLKKVLPGVEFDIEFYKGTSAVHVIAIFDDKDDEKVKKIEAVLSKTSFDNYSNNAYTITKMNAILEEINLPTILIAHQKGNINYKSKRDISSLGKDSLKRAIEFTYIDAIEFSNPNRERKLIDFKHREKVEKMVWVTGSDCHNWSVYPKQNNQNDKLPEITYIKSLPTFKGLVMAVTDDRRIELSKPTVYTPVIENIKIKIKSNEIVIPLSSGLNVIIGDNSIGKSLMMQSIFEGTPKKYNKYTKSKGIEIKKQIDLKKSKFDKQGSIRELFKDSSKKLKDIDFFKDKFRKLDTDNLEKILREYGEKLILRIEFNDNRKKIENDLDSTFEINLEKEQSVLLNIKSENIEFKSYNKIINGYEKIIQNIKNMLELKNLDKEDSDILKDNLEIYDKVYNKYLKLHKVENDKDIIYKKMKAVIANYESDRKSKLTSKGTRLSQYRDKVKHSEIVLVKFLTDLNKEAPKIINDDFENIEIKPMDNQFSKYIFREKLNSEIEIFTKEFVEGIILEPFDNRKVKTIEDIINLTTVEINNSDSLTKREIKTNFNEFYMDRLNKKIDLELKTKNQILEEDNEIKDGNSAGRNALYYIDLISKDQSIELYLVDQPGDDVSQNRINTDLIPIFNEMRESKQVIMVTHKPQLVVNLDVDNVICIQGDDNGNIEIKHGALEYESEGVNILEDVANNLDGGKDVIEKRWKRYGA